MSYQIRIKIDGDEDKNLEAFNVIASMLRDWYLDGGYAIFLEKVHEEKEVINSINRLWAGGDLGG